MAAGRVCFVAESQVGIGSVARTLKPLALRSSVADVEWVDVTYHREGGLLERLPLPERVRGTARGFLQARAGIQRGRYDALLFLTQNPAVFQRRAMKRIPTLLWTDVTPVQLDELAVHYDHPKGGGVLAERMKHELVRRTFLAARLCVAWSEWVRRSFIADYGVPEERTEVVPPGLDLSHWRAPDRGERVSGEPLRLLFVGGDFRRKGGEILLDVFRKELAGRCELDIVTRESVAEQPGVRVHHGLTAGSAPLMELYRRADLFVLPTLADCQPVASMEALAMCLLVVTTRISANAEVVEEGKCGWLVPAGDERALAERLVALARDPSPLAAFGHAGVESVRTRFDAARIVDRLLELALSRRGVA